MVNFPEFVMTGRIAIVTGAAGLLGKYHCEALLEAGASVIATDLSADLFETDAFGRLSAIYGERLRFHSLNVCDRGASERLILELGSESKSVTNLINNAAVNPNVSRTGLADLGLLQDFDNAQFNLEVNVGLAGAINCSAVFGVLMDQNGTGNILNIASDLSVIAPSQFLYLKDGVESGDQPKKPISYSAIKHGVVGVTKYLATYFESGNVRCNALSPGGVYQNQPIEFVERLNKLIPLKRMANEDEYKGAIKFLCSDASKYMNGQNIVIDGGRSVW